MFWLYALIVFGLPAAFAYYFIRGINGGEKKKGEKWKFTDVQKKNIGIVIISVILGYLITIMIKFIRGSEMNFWTLFFIVTIITMGVVYFLIKRKEKKSKK